MSKLNILGLFYTSVRPDFSLRNGRDIPLTAILRRLLRKGRQHILIHEESIHEQRRNERKWAKA